jgi:hypothetical protein
MFLHRDINTDVVFGIDFLEVYFIKLIVFVEHLSNVWLADLFEVHIEQLTVEVAHEGGEDTDCL